MAFIAVPFIWLRLATFLIDATLTDHYFHGDGCHESTHRKKIPYEMSLHGETRVDNYYWLRDDKRENSDVLDYLRAENNYGRKIMASQQPLQDRILKEIVDRLPSQDHSVPYVKNGYRYQSRYESGNEYAAYYRQPASSSEEDAWTLLLDANQRASHSEFYTMGALHISPDNNVMALAEDFLSRRQYGIRFRNLHSGSWYPEVLTNASSSFAWETTHVPFITCKNILKRCCLIRSGVMSLARHKRTIS